MINTDNIQDIKEDIQKTIDNNDIVLFMKGEKNIPACGFSSAVVQALKSIGIDDFLAIDVLKNSTLRQAIKDYSEWPTIPQLYIKGKFIGGCDIVCQMLRSGQLEQLLKEKDLL